LLKKTPYLNPKEYRKRVYYVFLTLILPLQRQLLWFIKKSHITWESRPNIYNTSSSTQRGVFYKRKNCEADARPKVHNNSNAVLWTRGRNIGAPGMGRTHAWGLTNLLAPQLHQWCITIYWGWRKAQSGQ